MFSITKIVVHPVIPDFCSIFAKQRACDHVHPESLPGLTDTFNHICCRFCCVHLFQFLQTVGAVSTGLFCLFPKIAENIIAQASRGRTVGCHLLKPLPILHLDILHLFRCVFSIVFLAFQQKLIDNDVLRRIVNDAFCRLRIPSGSSRFLIIIFQTLGHIVMQDIPDIGLIDPHSKRIGCDHHLDPIVNKILLTALSCFIAHSRMISAHGKSRTFQKQVKFIHILSCGTVNNSAFIRMFFQILPDSFFFLFCSLHLKIQILPVKSCHCHIRILQLQYFPDVCLYTLCCRGSKGCHDRTDRKLADK